MENQLQKQQDGKKENAQNADGDSKRGIFREEDSAEDDGGEGRKTEKNLLHGAEV